ncbi:hypothetical protein [Ulvibacter litoralis]|uniref:Uncharacterized protein n=1 Tax=Ulvibacter litoralis TaxID=227084 RepID=A0A1G7F7F2_9FLAO|nr:hypothetical protein [Ulvibacter litoralis]SDE71784.1 hypothetical protein SAMN05421855_102381 [Ulvibacter litoralis]
MLLFMGIPFFLYAQQNSNLKIYESYDALVGLENTGLFNGSEFKDLYVNTDKTYRYLDQFNFFKGDIVYKNQLYPNVLLRYDLLEDELITKSDDNLGLFNVKLHAESVSEFVINSRHFIQIPDTNLDLKGNHFFEVGYEGATYSMYEKHSKKKREKAVGSALQYSFASYNYFLLHYNDTYYIIHSIKDLRKAIPKKEKEIRSYYKSYQALYKSNPAMFMSNIIKYLDGSTATN